MADDTTKEHTRVNVVPIMVKKCPYCGNVLGLSENQCPGCKGKVGEPDKDGIAKVPGTWKKYVGAAVALTLAGLYIVYGRAIIGWFKAVIFGG